MTRITLMWFGEGYTSIIGGTRKDNPDNGFGPNLIGWVHAVK
jgi:hypothetical protein